jgi:NADH/F420H2 dehydrogenase subunit C
MHHKLTLNSVKNLIKTLPLYKIQFFSDEIVIFIESKNLINLVLYTKYHSFCQYKILTSIAGVDYPNKKLRFETSYELLSLIFNSRLRIKVVHDELESIDSCVYLFSTAGWHECEVWDMFGIFYKNHTNLRRILTDYGFEGHPLRKDFPLSGYLEVRYSDNHKRVVNEAIELLQEYRTFNFYGPWDFNNYE